MTALIPAVAALLAAPSTPVPAPLAPTTRVLAQSAGDWQIDYTFTPFNTTADPITLAPPDFTLELAGWLTNSASPDPGRLAPHGIPRHAAHRIDLSAGAISDAELIRSEDAAARCRERAILLTWATPAGAVPVVPMDVAVLPDQAHPKPVVIPPGGTLNVRIILRHDHEIHGIDPLLGRRALALRVGDSTLRDTLDLTREQFVYLPDARWLPMAMVSEEHRDYKFWLTSPYSLVLDASEPGNQYFRFPERKVRGGVKMRLRLRYFVAPGSDGEFRVRVAQYREGVNNWRVLGDGAIDRTLKARPGRWVAHEEWFVTQVEANAMALDLRITDSEVGVVWVDDVELDYVGAGAKGVGP